MNTIARDLLLKLLSAGNKAQAGVRMRAPVLTASQMGTYRELRNWHLKQECEETFLAARDGGHITLVRDKLNPDDGLIERIELLDVTGLAGFLGQDSYATVFEQARVALEPLRASYAVVDDVLQRWASMARVRGLGPQDVKGWLDATRVLDACAGRTVQGVELPLREFSARLFRDSKRVEKLAVELDVMLCDSIESQPRAPTQVWQELGLLPQEHPVLLAGRVQIDRGRVSGLLDAPYTGLPAASIRAVVSQVNEVLSIENLTTFHSEARRRCETSTLLIYTAGMPSPAWCSMYQRLLQSLPVVTEVNHWGDVDEGGFRIAARIAKVARESGHSLRPHHMSPEDVPEQMRVPASAATLIRMQRFASAAGWLELAAAVVAAGFTAEQESI
ncbi:MAG: DUF2399 domain-containing protein [Burkholderiaceae bacterium]|nr:DUF2399 domain-containing protein [Burkholderiaceae bacterium]